VEELTRAQCLDLLELHVVGRLGVALDGDQHIFPVNYRLVDEQVVLRTGAGTKLTAANGQNVVFEIDHIDRHQHRGWSVVVHGTGRDITEATDAASMRLRSVALRPWAPGPKTNWLVIADPTFSGRRITWDDDAAEQRAVSELAGAGSVPPWHPAEAAEPLIQRPALG
jgi:nitroimidazol reductase NimA-like FMN-containing flavoprotein (pyridoxamine 5'-phosphate oxidase superfamily)